MAEKLDQNQTVDFKSIADVRNYSIGGADQPSGQEGHSIAGRNSWKK